MSANSKIEWTDATWNPIGGCSIKSPGCKPCYAQKLAGTRLANHPLYGGTTTPNKDGKPVFNGKLTIAPDFHPVWSWPLAWRGAANPKLGPGMPSLIFVGDMSDLFHEDRPIKHIDRVIIAGLRSRHILQILTKRPDVMQAYIKSFSFERAVSNCRASAADPCPMISRDSLDSLGGKFGLRPRFSYEPDCSAWPSPRLWLGFSAERQKEFDERWPYMRELAAMGFVIYVSHEPGLGPITYPDDFLALGNRAQVIAGGTSGDDATPSHPDWFRHDRDQCAAAGVPFFFKQWGEWKPLDQIDERVITGTRGPHAIVHCDGRWIKDGDIADPPNAVFTFNFGKKAAGRLLDGIEHNGMPT